MKQDKYMYRFWLPLVNQEFAKQSIKYRYINNLNNMSGNYKEKLYTHSQDGFKRYIKFSIIATYSERRDIPNLYLFKVKPSLVSTYS